ELDKEVVALDHALAFGPNGDHLRVQGDDSSRPVCRGIGMGDAAAHGAFVANLHVAEIGCSLRQQGTDTPEEIRSLNLEVRSHCADSDLASFFANIVQVFDAADI